MKGKSFIDIEAALVSDGFCSSVGCVDTVSGRSKVTVLVTAAIFFLQQLGVPVEESLLEPSDQNRTVPAKHERQNNWSRKIVQ